MTRHGTLLLILVLLIVLVAAPVAAIGPVTGTVLVADDDGIPDHGTVSATHDLNAFGHIHDGDVGIASEGSNSSADGPSVEDRNETWAVDDEVATDTAVRPGEQVAGVVGVQQAELDGELESRSFGLQVANAATAAARAAVVADRLTRNRARLVELEERRSHLAAKRDSGEISAGEYRARMASLAVQSGTVERSANQSVAVANELPQDLRDARGIDQTALETLRTDARQLRGDAAGIAGGIAGERAGPPDGGVDRSSDRPGADELSGASDRFTFADGSGTSDGPNFSIGLRRSSSPSRYIAEIAAPMTFFVPVANPRP